MMTIVLISGPSSTSSRVDCGEHLVPRIISWLYLTYFLRILFVIKYILSRLITLGKLCGSLM